MLDICWLYWSQCRDFRVGVPDLATQLITERHYRIKHGQSIMSIQGIASVNACLPKGKPVNKCKPGFSIEADGFEDIWTLTQRMEGRTDGPGDEQAGDTT